MDEDATTIIVPANKLRFQELCDLLENLYKINQYPHKGKKEEQNGILFKFINDFQINAAKIPNKKNCSFYPILRLLLPELDRERGAYRLKETKLSQMLVNVLSLHKNSQDARKLLNFRCEKNSKHGSDFPSVAYFVLKTYATGSDKLLIEDINVALDKIAKAEHGSVGKIFDEVFSYIIKNTTAYQQKWLLRMILKDLKIGMSTNRILSVFHPDAPKQYELCNSIYTVCKELEESETRPLELGVKLFSAISPMLSERLDVMNMGQLPLSVSYQVELKFDGERFQLHMENGHFEYFSRRGFKYSESYGKTYESNGLMTPFLKDCFSGDAKNFILDGEMMGWHKVNQCFGYRGIAFDVKNITEQSSYRPCYCVFDLLYYNGRTLAGPKEKGGISLNERLKILDTLFKDVPGVIYHSKREIIKSSLDIVEAFNKANENGDEGIVVKETDSYYLPNRRNAGWYKIKSDYTEGAMEDLDLVIIGSDYTENKSQGIAKSFVVALADKLAPGAPRWLSIGRVSTGITYNDRERLRVLLEPHWQFYDKVPPPDNLVFDKEKPDLWILPENSVVLTVRGTELIKSKKFATEYTLRFPRVVAIREDKPYKDAMSLEEFSDLIKAKKKNEFVIKLRAGGRVNPDDVESVTIEARTRRKRKLKPLEVPDEFKTAEVEDLETLEPTSRALHGRKICVLSDDEDCKRNELVRLIRYHGGVPEQYIGFDTWCCVAGRKTIRVQNALDTLKCDIVNASWLRNLPKLNSPCRLPSPLYMLSITKKTQLALSRDYDNYGDSYTEFVDEDILKVNFDKMDNDNVVPIHLTTEEMYNLDMELFGNVSPYSFLRCCFIYFADASHRLAMRSRMYGAVICDIKSPNLTHVIVIDRSEMPKRSEIKVPAKDYAFVSEKWLEKCITDMKRVSETEFLI